MEETFNLGEHIELSGFREVDRESMIILKKMIGNFARKMLDRLEGFEKLKLTLKKTHETEGSVKFEIKGSLIINGKTETVEAIDRNLFYAVDTVLKKLENMQ